MAARKKYTELSVSELNTNLEEARRDIFNLRMQKASGHAVKTHLMRLARRNVARIKTILAQKEVCL
jgi:large subunit ribosomal protein L29